MLLRIITTKVEGFSFRKTPYVLLIRTATMTSSTTTERLKTLETEPSQKLLFQQITIAFSKMVFKSSLSLQRKNTKMFHMN